MALALAAAGAMAVAAAPLPEPVPEEAVLAAGHIVLGEQGLGLGEADAPIEIDDTHRTTVPEQEAYRFLGEPGAEVWELADAPWDTTGVAAGAVRGDSVRWSLTGVEGPGALAVYETGGGDGVPVARFDSADGLPDGYDLPAGGRGEDGTRWAFGAPGAYTLTFAVEAESAHGGMLITEATYTVLVGDAAIAQARAEADVDSQTGTGAGGGDGSADVPEQTPGTGSPADPATADASPSAVPAGQAQSRVAAAASADGTVHTAKKVLDEGHIDFAARVVDGKMQIHIKDGTVAGKTTWREPSSVVLHVKPAAKKSIPANDDFAFLGKEGDPVWLLDQVQQEGLLWPGWSTENIAAGATNGGVDFALTKVDGPGTYALYNYDGLSGATIRFNSRDGLPDSFAVPQNTHAHGGWAFSKEGVHRLTFRMSGTLADGTKVTDTETVAFAVGSVDPGSVVPGDGSGQAPSDPADPTDPADPADPADPSDSGSGGAGSTGGSSTGGSGNSSGSMASTGSGQALLLGSAAAVLTAVGAAAVLATRRRRPGRG